MFDVTNRSNASATSGVSEVSWCRVTAIDVEGTAPVPPWNVGGDTEELNFLAANYPIAAAQTSAAKFVTPGIVMEPGAVYDVNITVDSVNGSPTGGTWLAEIQVAPLSFRGLSIDAETSGLPRPWQALAAADTFGGSMLVNGDFPAALVDATSVSGIAGRQIVRGVRGGANARLMRVALWQSGLTGGTSPNCKFTVVVSRRRE